MALPFLIPLLLGGAVIGGATAKKRNQSFLQGALQGALLGGLGSVGAGAAGLGAPVATGLGAGAGAGAGAAGAAGATAAPALGFGQVAAQDAALKAKLASDAVIASKNAAVLKTGMASNTAANLAAESAAKKVGAEALANNATLKYAAADIPGSVITHNPAMAGTNFNATTSSYIPSNNNTLFTAKDLGVNINPVTGVDATVNNAFGNFNTTKSMLTANAGNIANPITEKIALSPNAKILATAKAKPMETMMFTSALGGMMGGGQGGGGAVSSGPLTQPGGFGNVPTVEESIGMDSGPRFISKGLFDESKRSMEEEEMALMYQKLSEAGLV
jgi:hypothetical protein